jgi:hypothetical protein
MKTVFINLSFFFLTVLVMQGQNYSSFFGENETHIVLLNNDYTLGETPLSKDSLAIKQEVFTQNNQVLKEVERYNSSFQESPLENFYLRENLTEGKLWLRSTIEGAEYLIVDLSLEVGDDVTIFGDFNSVTVSEVNYVNGKKQIVFDTQNLFCCYDGMGSLNDPVFFEEGVFPFLFSEPLYQSGVNFEYYFGELIPTCIIKDSNQTFSINDYWDINLNQNQVDWTTCEKVDLYNLSNEDFNPIEFSIYPNPTANLLYIESENLEIKKLSIFDFNGKQVIQTQFIVNQSISVNHLSEGMYLLKIETEKGTVTKKFVKK